MEGPGTWSSAKSDEFVLKQSKPSRRPVSKRGRERCTRMQSATRAAFHHWKSIPSSRFRTLAGAGVLPRHNCSWRHWPELRSSGTSRRYSGLSWDPYWEMLQKRCTRRGLHTCATFFYPLKPAAGTFSINFWMNACTPPDLLPRIHLFTSLFHAAGTPRAGLISMKK